MVSGKVYGLKKLLPGDGGGEDDDVTKKTVLMYPSTVSHSENLNSTKESEKTADM